MQGVKNKEIEDTLISVCGDLADLFGNPRSQGQVFGLLYSTTKSLSQEAIAERLQISPASVSLALKALESFGAVRKTPAPAARKQATYTAMTSLRPLVEGFVQIRLIPKLSASQKKLAALHGAIAKSKSRKIDPEIFQRICLATNWHLRAAFILSTADGVMKGVAE